MKRLFFEFLVILLGLTVALCGCSTDHPEPQTEGTGAPVSISETNGETTVDGWYYATMRPTEPPTERPIIKEPGIDIITQLKLPCNPNELLRSLEALHVPIVSYKEYVSSYDPDLNEETYYRQMGIESPVIDGRWYEEEGNFNYYTADGDWFHFTETGIMIYCTFLSMRFSTGEGARIGDTIEQVSSIYHPAETQAMNSRVVFEKATKDGAYVFSFEDGLLDSWYFAEKVEQIQ